MAKKFSELSNGDIIYRVDVDWKKSYEESRLVYTVRDYFVNDYPYNNSMDCIYIPYLDDFDNTWELSVPFECYKMAISYTEPNNLATTDKRLILELLMKCLNHEICKNIEEIDRCSGIIQEQSSLMESNNELRNSLMQNKNEHI